MKKVAGYLLRAVMGVIIFLILYVIAALALQHIAVGSEQGNGQDVSIYIKTNGVHTDIVVPLHNEQEDWRSEIPFANTLVKDTNYSYLALGWGDKGFYLQTPEWKDLKASVAFNAAFGLSTSAMHATFYRQMTEGEDCRKIRISKEQYRRLIRFINESFRVDANGHFMNIKTNANYGMSDAFYEAKGRYNLFYTCNTWANQALKSCGQKHCLWTVLDKGIFAKYE